MAESTLHISSLSFRSFPRAAIHSRCSFSSAWRFLSSILSGISLTYHTDPRPEACSAQASLRRYPLLWHPFLVGLARGHGHVGGRFIVRVVLLPGSIVKQSSAVGVITLPPKRVSSERSRQPSDYAVCNRGRISTDHAHQVRFCVRPEATCSRALALW